MYFYNSVLDPVNWLSTKPCLQLCNGLISFYITAAGNSERGVLQKSASVSPGRMMVTTGRMTAFVAVQSFFLRLFIPSVKLSSQLIVYSLVLSSKYQCVLFNPPTAVSLILSTNEIYPSMLEKSDPIMFTDIISPSPQNVTLCSSAS